MQNISKINSTKAYIIKFSFLEAVYLAFSVMDIRGVPEKNCTVVKKKLF